MFPEKTWSIQLKEQMRSHAYCLIFLLLLRLRQTEESILQIPSKLSIYSDVLANDTRLIWLLSPPWQKLNEFVDGKPFDKSEYFSIDENDLLTNESFIQTSTLFVCNELNISFYSKINSFQSNIDLQLYIQRNHIWSKQWQFTYENLQWHLHQLNLPLTNAHEDIQLRFVPTIHSTKQISMTITIVNMTTNRHCISNESLSKHRRVSSTEQIILVIFGCGFLIVVSTFVIIIVYGFVNRHYGHWFRKRSSSNRRKTRRTRNIVRDESTIVAADRDEM